MGWVEVTFERFPRWMKPLLPVLGLFTVGLMSIRWAPVLGNGFDTVHAMLLGTVQLKALLLFPVLKLAASAICTGSGVPGGLFTPSLFYGAAIGGAAGELLALVFPGLAPPGALALVGMAGVLAGTTHAAVSSVLIIFEMTGRLRRHPPAHALRRDRRRDEPRDRAGLPLHRAAPPPRRAAAGVPAPRLAPPHARSRRSSSRTPSAPRRRMPFDQMLKKLLSLPPGHDLYVTTVDNELLGVIQLDALKGTISDQAHLGMIVAADVVNRDVQPITTTMTLAEVAARFGDTDLERLPVVDDRRRLVGTVAMRDLLARGTF